MNNRDVPFSANDSRAQTIPSTFSQSVQRRKLTLIKTSSEKILQKLNFNIQNLKLRFQSDLKKRLKAFL